MSKADLAPVALFVYNRPWHTRQALEALMQNELAESSSLFIFSDGAKADADPEQDLKIKEVRRLVREKKWCGQVEIIESETNKGLAASVISGVTKIIADYGKVIVLEDDLVTSKYFLKYMNDALTRYEKEEQVAAVHGYTFPLKMQLPQTFFLNDTGCWGWGTWLRAWTQFEIDGKKLLDAIEKAGLNEKFDYDNSYPHMQMLKDQAKGLNSSWAILWYASNFLKEKLTLYPGQSLVKNIGNDGSGTHGTSDKTETILSNEPVMVNQISIHEDAAIRKELGSFFRKTSNPSFFARLKRFIKSRTLRVLFKLGFSRRYFKRRYPNVSFGKGVQITGVANTEIGKGACIADNVWLNTNFRNKEITLKIGENVLIGRGSICSSSDLLEIGAYTCLAGSAMITNSYQPFDNINVPYMQVVGGKGKLLIEENCWIGMHAVISGGITIGRGSVIGANSLISADVPPFSVAVGNPQRIVKMYNPQSGKWESVKDNSDFEYQLSVREKLPVPARAQYLSTLIKNAAFKVVDPVCAGREIWI